MRIYTRSTVGKLVQIGLADDYRARGPQAHRQLAVAVGGRSPSTFEPAVVTVPSTSQRSLSATGIP